MNRVYSYSRLILTMFVVASLVFCALPAAGGTLDAEHVWKEYRKIYPYLMQAIALQQNNDEYVIIVSEPPPHVSEDDLRMLLPTVEFKKHTIGHKGWVKDAIANLTLDKEALHDLIGELHRMLYFTSYKAYVINLPAKPHLMQRRPKLDLQIAADDVVTWMLTGSEKSKMVKLNPIIGGDPVTFDKIDESHSLVYHSDPQGLVGWWIPKLVLLSDCTVQARQFAVDSDLVVGAIGDERGVLILGRERIVPVELLPPLQVETILLLGTIRKDELMQTINPQLLSCYINTEPKERWELNLLSPELYNTEFGTLLAIADVLLKSWSLHELNTVRGFRDYPRPAKWPFKQPLHLQINTESLVFNYNSEAAGRRVDISEGRSTFSVVRTGVLPISYIPKAMVVEDPSEEVRNAEQTAYEWFAKQGDPHIVRVVQYTALLQAFRSFEVLSTGPPKHDDDIVDKSRRELVNELLEKPRKFTESEVKALLKRMKESPDFADLLEYQKKAVDGQGNTGEKKSTASDTSFNFIKRKIDQLRKKTDENFQYITDQISGNSRFFKWLHRDLLVTYQVLASAERFDETLADRLAGLAKGWIHSPVLIYDHNRGQLAHLIGGHNLKIRTPRLKADPKALKGRPPVQDVDGSYRIHPSDLRNIVVRGRNRFPKLVRGPPAKSMATTLGFKPAEVSSSRRFGWWRTSQSKQLSNAEVMLVADFRKKRPDAVFVFQQKDGTYLVDNGRTVFEGRTHREAVDIVLDTTHGKEIDVQLTGMTADQADAFGSTLFLRRKGLDRIVSTLKTRSKPISNLPLEFQPQKYNIGALTIKSFQVTETRATAAIEIPANLTGEPSARLNMLLRAGRRAMAAIKKSKDLLRTGVQNALKPSKDAKEFHGKFEKIFKQEMERAFPGTDFSDLKVQTNSLLRILRIIISKNSAENQVYANTG